jgi:DNA-binding transcriptional LysR family regulator
MTRPEAWADWLCVVGQEQLQLPPARRFEHFYEMIQAAACSLGVAIVPHVLAHEELRSGRLIAPFGFVEGNRRLSLWIAPHLASRPDMKKLERWLVNEFRVLATSM